MLPQRLTADPAPHLDKGKGELKKQPIIGDPNRTCFGYLFGTCWHHASTKIGEHCGGRGGIHREAPTDADRNSEAFKKKEEQYGPWTKEQMKPKANAVRSPPASPRNAGQNAPKP